MQPQYQQREALNLLPMQFHKVVQHHSFKYLMHFSWSKLASLKNAILLLMNE